MARADELIELAEALCKQATEGLPRHNGQLICISVHEERMWKQFLEIMPPLLEELRGALAKARVVDALQSVLDNATDYKVLPEIKRVISEAGTCLATEESDHFCDQARWIMPNLVTLLKRVTFTLLEVEREAT